DVHSPATQLPDRLEPAEPPADDDDVVGALAGAGARALHLLDR
ncbi:MAG: hypothetical protein QOH43_4684, partial [Solirubrobacteraceae bacterium]|nr:hypothetical protein [Solirubrobacteraceae bacterium]